MRLSPSTHISISQARNAVVVAIAVSLLLSALTFFFNLNAEGNRIDTLIARLINTTKGPMAQAANMIDKDLSNETINGLFQYPQIGAATLETDFGTVLGSRSRTSPSSTPQILVDWLTVWQPEHRVELLSPSKTNIVGFLDLRLDNALIVSDFLRRTGQGVLLSFLHDLVMSLILTLIFYATLTKPLLGIIHSFRTVDPSAPGKTTIPTPDRHGQDEIGQLVSTVNTFLGDLSESLAKRQAVEEELIKTEELYRGIFENAAEGLFQSTADGRFISCNPAMAKILGYDSPEDLMRLTDPKTALYVTPNSRDEMLAILAEHGSASGLESRFRCKDNTVKWGAMSARATFDGVGEIVLIDGILEDITKRKQAEQELAASNRELRTANEEIQKSLTEKEVLIREIHHRVKNNLQVISSLLGLQAMDANSPEVADLLMESKNRIKSMALIHEGLYRSEDFSHVTFSDYIRKLCSGLLMSQSSGKAIDIDYALDDHTIPVDTAIPCSLILNELVTNCLKHAFNDMDSGRISIRFAQQDDRLVLEVADNGCGLPDEFHPEALQSLGMQLIMGLADQLHGDLEIGGRPGARFTIRFPVPPKTN